MRTIEVIRLAGENLHTLVRCSGCALGSGSRASNRSLAQPDLQSGTVIDGSGQMLSVLTIDAFARRYYPATDDGAIDGDKRRVRE